MHLLSIYEYATFGGSLPGADIHSHLPTFIRLLTPMPYDLPNGDALKHKGSYLDLFNIMLFSCRTTMETVAEICPKLV